MLRFDSFELFKALDKKRQQLNMTWKQVADEIGVSPSTIQKTRQGGRMEVDGMLRMVNWLNVPVESFVKHTKY